MGGKLDIGTAGFHTHFPDHGEAGVPHDLILAVGQSLDRGDGDGVAGVDAHGVEVFDGTNDHAVVGVVTHDLHFIFLPAEQALVDEDFANRREVDPPGADGFEFLTVISNAAAGAAEGESRADDEREGADVIGHATRFLHGVGDAALWHIEAYFDHGLLEFHAVFALLDGVGFGPDHTHVMFFQHAGMVQGHGKIQGRLAAEGGQQGVRFFALDDFFHHLGREGFNVGSGGEFRVRHDGGGIGIDEDDGVAFLLQGLAGLNAGIIEFASLADNNRAGADDEDFADGGVLGHVDGKSRKSETLLARGQRGGNSV